MEKEAIIKEISKLMYKYGQPKYNTTYVSDMTSNQIIKVHQITYKVDLSNGSLLINLNYDSGKFNYTYHPSYTGEMALTTADFMELYNAGTHFDGAINPSQIMSLLEMLKS